MRATTVRFGDDLWKLLDEESSLQEISAAQFIRDATVVRLAFLAARRGDAGSEQSIEEIATRAARRKQGDRQLDAVGCACSIRPPRRALTVSPALRQRS